MRPQYATKIKIKKLQLEEQQFKEKIARCCPWKASLGVHVVALSKICQADWLAIGGEGVKPQPFLVRATLSSFSHPSHLEILVLRLLCVLKFLILEDKTIFF